MLIEIHGKVGEGKTTLALALEKFLIEQGFANVSITDPDLPADQEALSSLHFARMQAMRMETLTASESLRIDIVTTPDRLDLEERKKSAKKAGVPPCDSERINGVCVIHPNGSCQEKKSR